MTNGLAAEILAAEQPVERTRLAKLIANACGLQRVRQNRVADILRSLSRTVVRFDRSGFAWEVGRAEEEPMTYRRGALDTLSIDEVHPAEIQAAVAEAHRRNGFAEKDDVLREALASLGGRSLTSTVRPALEKGYKQVTGAADTAY